MADESEYLRKQPRQSRSRAVVNAIVEAADQLLTRSGDPGELSLQGIADRAGVGIGSLYDYFANREGLLGLLLRRLTDANFESLAKQVDATRGRPFAEGIGGLVDATLDVYLALPARTRGVIGTIFRLGWVKPVIAERDRFAQLVAERLLEERPQVERARVEAAARVLCDAIMGVVMTELWREPPPEQRALHRRELQAMVAAHVATLQ